MYCASVLLPLWTGMLQLLEIVSEGQGEVELICLRILHCDDVVLFKQVPNRVIEPPELEKVDRVLLVVLCIKAALDNDVRLEFSN